jgi:hypothetical protein
LVLKLHDLSLIPVSANAWLAKNQKEADGSIILVHGNSNEPKGIDAILRLLHEGNINWLPLADMFKS